MKPVYRLLHVCTDPKHLGAVDRFIGPEFDNRVILAQSDRPIPGMRAERLNRDFEIEIARQGRPTLLHIASVAQGCDLVVVHDLDRMKSMVVERIGEGVPIGWRVYGYEIYSRRPEGLYTERTLAAGGQDSGPGLARRILNGARYFATWHTLKRPSFDEAVRRIDLTFGVVPEEYPELEARWGDLPPFFRFPLKPHYGTLGTAERTSRNVVLIGNSRSPYNNHLDVLDDVVRFGSTRQWRFVVPFGYGPDGRYTAAVRAVAREHPSVDVIDNFLPTDQYLRLFQSATAAVYNTFRQLALWNIFTALFHGLKVYIPARNPAFPWLRRHGVAVHEVETFGVDLQVGALQLRPEEVTANRAALHRLAEEYSYADFRQQLARWLEARAE